MVWHRIVPVLLTLLTVGCAHTAPLSTFAKTADRVSASVVRITGVRADHRPIVCTGAVVAPTWVLTAAHCMSEPLSADGVAASVLKVSETYDLMLLSVDTRKPSLEISDEKAERFQQLTAIGYAFGLTKLAVMSVRVLLVDVVPEEHIAPSVFVQPQYIEGMSGGPVVDAEGRLVGVIQNAGEGAGLHIGTLLIRAFLLGVD